MIYRFEMRPLASCYATDTLCEWMDDVSQESVANVERISSGSSREPQSDGFVLGSVSTSTPVDLQGYSTAVFVGNVRRFPNTSLGGFAQQNVETSDESKLRGTREGKQCFGKERGARTRYSTIGSEGDLVNPTYAKDAIMEVSTADKSTGPIGAVSMMSTIETTGCDFAEDAITSSIRLSAI